MENQVTCSCCYKPLNSALEQYGKYDWFVCFNCFILGFDKWEDRLLELSNGDRLIRFRRGDEDQYLELLHPFEWELPVFHDKEYPETKPSIIITIRDIV